MEQCNEAKKLPWNCEVLVENLSGDNTGATPEYRSITLDPSSKRIPVGRPISKNYNLVTNERANDIARQVLVHGGYDPDQLKYDTIWNGKSFVRSYKLIDTKEDVAPGDFVCATLDVKNSYDMTQLFGIEFNMQRLICSNGMMVGHELGGFKFRHSNPEVSNEFTLLDEITQAGDLLNHLDISELIEVFREMQTMPYSMEDYQKDYKALSLTAPQVGKAFLASENEGTQWDCYNSITNMYTQKNTIGNRESNRKASKFYLDKHLKEGQNNA